MPVVQTLAGGSQGDWPKNAFYVGPWGRNDDLSSYF